MNNKIISYFLTLAFWVSLQNVSITDIFHGRVILCLFEIGSVRLLSFTFRLSLTDLYFILKHEASHHFLLVTGLLDACF